MISLGRAGWDAKSKLQQPPQGLVCSAPCLEGFPSSSHALQDAPCPMEATSLSCVFCTLNCSSMKES